MHKHNRVSKVAFTFCVAFVFMIIFLISTFFLTSKRNIPNTEKERTNLALRGSIISQDGFIIANSRQFYRAEIDLRSIKEEKLELFLKLFQIYSDIDNMELAKIKSNLLNQKRQGKNNFILKNDLNSKQASHLKELSKKLYNQNFFSAFIGENGTQTRGLDISEHKENRYYLSNDALEPVLGYTQSFENKKGKAEKNKGKNGLEKFYEECLESSQNEKISGAKDIGGNIILNLGSFSQKRVNGCDIYLNISLRLQKNLEKMMDLKREEFGADEILLAIMESKSGKIRALATTRRFNPQNRQNDEKLNSAAIQYQYEPGSVIKPFILATALVLEKVKINEQINTHNGRYKLGKYLIEDYAKKPNMSVAEVLFNSSNIGMVEISQKLSKIELISGLKLFNFGQKSEIDLPYERNEELPNYANLGEVKKATISYGYGIRANFIQILSAYNVFNNEGFFIPPQLAQKFKLDGKEQSLEVNSKQRILSKSWAKTMQSLLIDVVELGTAKKAKQNGLVIGGKTGTARIAENKSYKETKRYNASFFGFANDATNNYTIGVLVRNPTKGQSVYYASQSAIPVFNEAVKILIKENFLKPEFAN